MVVVLSEIPRRFKKVGRIKNSKELPQLSLKIEKKIIEKEQEKAKASNCLAYDAVVQAYLLRELG